MDALHAAAVAITKARRIAVLTGAGVSAESGIPTFRSAQASMGALWKDFDPATLATPEAFARDPERVTRWYDHRRLGCLAALPNPGHLALADLERDLESRGGEFILLTQNVDRLHQKAGSRRVVELHGTLITWRCTLTGRHTTPEPAPMREFPAPSPFDPRGLLRPNVVWFGERLPDDAVAAAENAAASCDVFMAVGTSSQVYPAAGFIHAAMARGAVTIEVNPETTPISDLVDIRFEGPGGEVLPRLLAAARTGMGA
jgi:NAD-dependent deacetylase